MNDPKQEHATSGSGGSSDGDTQPDDTGATGERGDLPGSHTVTPDDEGDAGPAA
jgi:hypothetical protein